MVIHVPALLVFDARWIGSHGIGRFAGEVRKAMPPGTRDLRGEDPVSLSGVWQSLRAAVNMAMRGRSTFYSPGFAPPIFWRGPIVLTVHDLMHIDVHDSPVHVRAFYRWIVRPHLRRARAVLTVSEESRRRVATWAGVPLERVHNVGNGVDDCYRADGPSLDLGAPYILYIGNHKPHKNVPRLIAAFAQAELPEGTLLAFSGPRNETILDLARQVGVEARVRFLGMIPEAELPATYRGASALAMPSIHEGFGLPGLEAAASGTPAVVGQTSAMPEVLGEVAVYVDAMSTPSIARGLERAFTDEAILLAQTEGPRRAELYKWEDVGKRVIRILDAVRAAA